MFVHTHCLQSPPPSRDSDSLTTPHRERRVSRCDLESHIGLLISKPTVIAATTDWLGHNSSPRSEFAMPILLCQAAKHQIWPLGLGLIRPPGAQGTPEGVEDNGSLTRVAAFPIGIDPERFQRALERVDVRSNIAELLNRYAGRKVRKRSRNNNSSNNKSNRKSDDSNMVTNSNENNMEGIKTSRVIVIARVVVIQV